MKKISLALVCACCTLMLVAQDIKVNYSGAKPTISDFAWAIVTDYANNAEDCDESAEAFRQAWVKHCKGLPVAKHETLTVDEKNGYILFESRYENHLLKVEMCYWNMADKKHKLVAYNVSSFTSGKYSPGQYDNLSFYRYNNATKKMTMNNEVGFDISLYDGKAEISYSLPRTGKDITATSWPEKGPKKQRIIKWNGSKFVK